MAEMANSKMVTPFCLLQENGECPFCWIWLVSGLEKGFAFKNRETLLSQIRPATSTDA